MSEPTSRTPVASTTRVAVRGRQFWDRMFLWFCKITAITSVILLVFLLASIGSQGTARLENEEGVVRPVLSPSLVTNNNSSDPMVAGLRPALWGTIWTCLICGLLSLPIGVGTAILLEEFRPQRWYLRKLHSLVRINIANLAGVPSVVYGILALTAFVQMFGVFDGRPLEFGTRYYDQFWTEDENMVYVPVRDAQADPTVLAANLTFLKPDFSPAQVQIIPAKGTVPKDIAAGTFILREDSEPGRFRRESWYFIRLPLGNGMLAGGLTLMLVVLPIVTIASQEAISAVPPSLREGALGLGATPWQVVWNVTLPSAIPGIMTGAILAMSRAIGEAAPVLIVGGAAFLSRSPNNLMADFTVMPLQIFTWAGYPQKPFQLLAAGGILLLLAVLFTFNAIAVWIRYRAQRSLS